MTKNILLLTASYGSGHNAATNALTKTLEQQHPEIQYYTLDLLDSLYDLPGKFTKTYYEDFCSKYPAFWEKTFNMLDDEIVKKIIYGFKNPFLVQSKFQQKIEEINPSVIIVLFPFWLGPLKYYIKRKGKNFTTATVITDAVNIHSLWHIQQDYVDYFFLIDKYSKENFIEKFNHQKDNLYVSFFPIEKKYFTTKEQITNQNITILLTSLNEQFMYDLLEKLSFMEDKNVTILKGREDKLFEKLKNDFEDIESFNFYEFIDLKESLRKQEIDLIISKPGGAICCECIATDTPIIAPDFVPGQEEENKRLLEISETGIYEKDVDKIIFHIKYTDWSRMLPNFKKIKKEDSCEFVLNKLL